MSPPSSALHQSHYANSASIVVQVGQCGNQIGPQLFSLAQHSDCNALVDRSGYCRAVCVDTEDKVANVRMLNKHLKKVQYRECNVVNGHFGRGSNWAMGYNLEERYGYRGEDSFMDQCIDRVRLEAERCDTFMATSFIHSLAGGTGSGVGSRLTQLIRDMFPNRYILSVVVAPLSIGENPMQCYNSLMCCSRLSSFSDQIILLENDSFSSKFDSKPITVNNSSNGKGAPKTAAGSSLGFDQINEQFAQNLAGIIFPTDNSSESGSDICAKQYKQVQVGMEIPELIRSVCPMPSLRFSRIDSVIRTASSSGSSQSLDSMLMSLSNAYKSSLARLNESDDVAVSKTGPSCISCVSVLRGPIGKPVKYDVMKERLHFLRPVLWNPFWLDLWSSTDALPTLNGPGKNPSVTLCSNGSSASRFLARVWSTARMKFDHNAYLHWYEKFECTKADFEEAFDTIESVVQDYNEADA